MFIRKIAKLLFVTTLVLVICASASFAQDERSVLTVGKEKFSDKEIMAIIVDSMSSGNEMMAKYTLSESTLEERREIVSHLSDAILFAEGAKDAGLHLRPEIAIKIRWQVAKMLIDAYFENIGDKWDFSKAAAQKYYNTHRADFTRGEAVRVAHILTETETEAIMAALEAMGELGWDEAVEYYSIDDDTNMDSGDLGWVEEGTMPSAMEEAIKKGQPGQIVGPVQSEYGWHVILIGERRPAGQLTFDEAANDVFIAMEADYIETALEKIREKHPVDINDDALSTLGGVPIQ